jgi:uncharacterized membrane-anchored protein YjiN (DUF445 family)
MNLNEILEKIKKWDEEIVEYDALEYAKTIDELRAKIDAIVEVRADIESRIERHKNAAKEHSEIAKQLENSWERLKKWVLFSMQNFGITKEFGNKYHVSITTHQKLDISMHSDDITPQIYAKYSEAIKREFVWDKTHIKQNIEKYSDIARIVNTQSIKVGVRK